MYMYVMYMYVDAHNWTQQPRLISPIDFSICSVIIRKFAHKKHI